MSSLSERIGIRYPVFQAPMAGVSTPAMAAAVTKAGGLGALGLGAASPQSARAAMAEFRALSGGPLHANLFCHAEPVRDKAREAAWIDRSRTLFASFGAEPPSTLSSIYPSFSGNAAMTEVLLDLRPEVVSFHFGLPDAAQIEALRAGGAVLMASATSVAEAQMIEAAGLDVVIAQGWEAGGHRGLFDPDAADEQLSMMELLSRIGQAVSIPVVAAGGLMNGHDIRRALDAGAQAAQLGTVFVGCAESAADEAYRSRLSQGGETVMTRAISGRPARCLTNGFTAWAEGIPDDQVPDYPVAYDLGKALNAAAKSASDGGFGAQWAGMGAGMGVKTGAAIAAGRTDLPASEIMAQLVAEIQG